MDKCIIVARYNEDVDWLSQYIEFKITIYNKGKKLKKNDFSNIIELENVGRESHTWLYHIVENYEKLNDYNIFLQAQIDDLNCMAYRDPNDYIKNINKYGFSVSRFGLLTPFHWSWNVGVDKDHRYKSKWINKEISRSKLGFRNFSKKLFPNIPLFVATSYGGCFAVKKETIKQHDILFYKELLKILSNNKNPIEGHFMERLWCYIFTKNKPLLDSFKDVIKTKIERSKIW